MEEVKHDGAGPREITAEGGRYLLAWDVRGGIWSATACYDWEEGKVTELEEEVGPVVSLEGDGWTARLFNDVTKKYLKGETVEVAGILGHAGEHWVLLLTPSGEEASWLAFDVRNVLGVARPERKGMARVSVVPPSSGPEED